MLLSYEAMFLAERCYESFELLGVDFGMAFAYYAVEMMVMGLKGGCELVALFPSVADGRGDAKACKKFNCSIDTCLVYYWKHTTQRGDAYRLWRGKKRIENKQPRLREPK